MKFNCTSCRTTYDENQITKQVIDENRYAAFCPYCNTFIRIVDTKHIDVSLEAETKTEKEQQNK